MNCMEARRMVTPFINKELSDKETEQFLKHIEHCSDCMDELDIYFTVYRALDTLDSGSHQEYNFRKMMQEEIRAAKRRVLVRKVSRGLRGAVIVLAEILLLFSVFTGYEMKRGENRRTTLHRAIERLTYRRTMEEPVYELPETETAKTVEMTETAKTVEMTETES